MGDVVVTDADREVAAALWRLMGNSDEARWAEEGLSDLGPVVGIVARHRIAAHASGLAEGRKQALEEAAKVADYRGMQYAGLREGMLFDCLAAVIRAIGDKE